MCSSDLQLRVIPGRPVEVKTSGSGGAGGKSGKGEKGGKEGKGGAQGGKADDAKGKAEGKAP